MIGSKNQIDIFNDFEADSKTSRILRIIHFNDVYNIEGQKIDPVGGAARFKTALNFFQNNKTLTVFSGDALSPSTLSLFYKGDQMVECLNMLNINAAAIGNHEFDMGVDLLKSLIQKSNFPWLISNLFDRETNRPFLDLKIHLITNVDDVKIGIISLAEKDWVRSLSAVSYDDIFFESFIMVARNFAKSLKEQEKCDIVIALTHMRWKNDLKLAEKVPDIDIILGGHDHDYEVKQQNEKWIIKSGSDFKEFSVIELEIPLMKKARVKSIKKIIVDSQVDEDRDMKVIVQKYLTEADKKLDEEIGLINTDLDGLYDSVRSKETNLGNLFCDIILSSVNADCAIINGGSLRSDKTHPAGTFTRRDLRSILPFDSELVVVELTGAQLHQFLENCLANYEQKGGRFPQVSGIFFTYYILNQPGQRVNPDIIKIQNEYLNTTKIYRLATNTFLKNVDPILKDSKIVISTENIPFLYTLVENYFNTVNQIKSTSQVQEYQVHRSQIIPKVIINSLLNKCSKDPDVLQKKRLKRTGKSHLSFRFVALFVLQTLKHRKVLLYKDKMEIKKCEKFRKGLQFYEQKSLEMAPGTENRSVQILNYQELLVYLEEKKNQNKATTDKTSSTKETE